MIVTSHRDTIVSLHSQYRALGGGVVEIRRVDLEAPWRWIMAGWRDMERMPHISLIYGAVFAAVAVGLFLGLMRVGMSSAILALAGGFLLIGPVLAVGLYEGSRQLEQGRRVRISDVVLAVFRTPGQLVLLGLALLIIYIVWMQTAFLLFMVFMGTQPFPPLDNFMSELLLTTRGVALLTVGTIEGAVLASVVFMICAVSAPMLMDRSIGVTDAILTSVEAVKLNWKPMALWATLIAAFMIVGLLTLSAGLVVAFPLIGHATWHAYRDLVAKTD